MKKARAGDVLSESRVLDAFEVRLRREAMGSINALVSRARRLQREARRRGHAPRVEQMVDAEKCAALARDLVTTLKQLGDLQGERSR